MSKRLQTINESLQLKGPTKGVYASCNVTAVINDDGKVKTSVYADVDGVNAAMNESVDRVKGDKLEMLQRDLRAIMNDVKSKIEKAIEKYDLNK